MRGCSAADQLLDDAKFAEPLPWIGLYVAGASIVCALAMFLDASHGFRSRKFWFPCRWFSLNATTLTLLSVATKFPVDLNTSMPGHVDQLSKLSGTILLCIVMSNFMPSIGGMNGSDILSNIVALAILVITVMANICIQIGTGVIYVFWFEHILVMSFLVVMLATLVATAFTVPVMKSKMEEKFNVKFSTVHIDIDAEQDNHSEEILKKEVEKFWLMAHTGSPQYVVGRSATCIASGAFCLAAVGILVEAYFWSRFHGSKFCSGVSDYGWSTKVVFYSQAAAILVGSVAPVIRWFNARNFRGSRGFWKEFTIEEYWVEWLKDWKVKHLPFDDGRRWKRKVIHTGKNLVSNVFIKVQKVLILLSKIVRMFSVLPLDGILGLRRLLVEKLNCIPRRDSLNSPSTFVLHLDGEDGLLDAISRSEHKDVNKWIEKGKKKKPAKLIRLIKENNSKSRGGFAGLVTLDRNRPTDLDLQGHEPNNCWAMPIVTFTAIAVALPNLSWKEKKSLLMQVYQGLRYVRLVEGHLDCRGFVNAQEAADILWTSIELHTMWFDVDLSRLALKSKDCRSMIEVLQREARTRFDNFWKEETEKEEIRNHIQWPGQVLAYHCMYKVTRTILDDYEQRTADHTGSYPYLPRTDNNLFLWIRETVSDIIRACLTNIPRVIYMECVCNTIEEREDRVRNAAWLLGEAKDDILPILAEQKIQLDKDQRPYIDEWITKLQNPEMS